VLRSFGEETMRARPWSSIDVARMVFGIGRDGLLKFRYDSRLLLAS
jgi:hypothetical protein